MLLKILYVSSMLFMLTGCNAVDPSETVNIYNWNFFSQAPGTATKLPQTLLPVLPKPAEECDEKNVVIKKPELYWKDYYGPPVPEDAVLAGVVNKLGKPVGVYIGQALFSVKDSGIQPVAIYNDSDSVAQTYTEFERTNKNIKILCTNVPKDEIEKFLTWIPSEEADQYDFDRDFVITGTELSKVTFETTNLYSARGNYQDEYDLVAGKIVMGRTSLRFYFVYEDREVEKKEGFEVLAYTEALTRKKKPVNLDVRQNENSSSETELL